MAAPQRPRLFVVDDDRAVLSLAGTNLTCLDVLRALRSVKPECEAVVTTGYENLAAAVQAIDRSLPEGSIASDPAPAAERPAALVDVERDHIVRTLARVRGNKAVAARLLGVSRRALYRQLERHGLHNRTPSTRRGAGTHAAQAESTR